MGLYQFNKMTDPVLLLLYLTEQKQQAQNNSTEINTLALDAIKHNLNELLTLIGHNLKEQVSPHTPKVY